MHTCRKYKRITARTYQFINSFCPAPVSMEPQNSTLVLYCRATGLPYCPPPAREYPSRLRLHKRHDTDSRWRQVTKLPRPCPPYPPFTLGYGNNWFSFYWRLMAVPALPYAGHRPFGLPLVPLKSSCLTGRHAERKNTSSPSFDPHPQAVIAPMPGPLFALQPPHNRRNLDTDYEQGIVLLFFNVRKGEI